MKNLKEGKVIAAVRCDDDFNAALESDAGIIFDLSPDIISLADRVKLAHNAGKKLFIHIDLAAGIGKDKSGIIFAKKIGIDGIISTRVNIIKIARELEIFTVQRFFTVDSHSVETTVESLKASKADMIEVMPGIAGKVIDDLRKRINTPIIAGGLIDTRDEVELAISCGAAAISTGKKELWNI